MPEDGTSSPYSPIHQQSGTEWLASDFTHPTPGAQWRKRRKQALGGRRQRLGRGDVEADFTSARPKQTFRQPHASPECLFGRLSAEKISFSQKRLVSSRSCQVNPNPML